jgi:membrane protease YdiL (CAAX protease family)
MKRLFTMKKQTILAILAFPLIFMPGLITGLLNDIVIKPTAWWGFNLIYAIACLLSIILLWFILKKCGYSMRDIGLAGFKANHVGWAILFFFCGILLWYAISVLLQQFGIETRWGHEISFTAGYEIAIILFYAVIAAPIAEELLFRGFFITYVGKLIRPWTAGVLPLILFALYHYLEFGLAGGILMLAWSVLPTVLFLWKRSLYPGWIMHAINNLFAYVILGLFASYYA